MDAYDRQARLYPAALVAAPAILLALALFSLPQWWGGLIGFAASGGLVTIVIQIVRDLGVNQQDGLWNAWGGKPTTIRLRWAGATNQVLHQRRHDDVAAGTGISLPTSAEELADSDRANEIYDTAATILRQKTRNEKDFGLVKTELTNYGYRRNVYGLKPIGITAALVCLAVELTLVVLGVLDVVHLQQPLMVICAGVSLVWALGWIFLVNPTFVRRAADRYADTLIAAASDLA